MQKVGESKDSNELEILWCVTPSDNEFVTPIKEPEELADAIFKWLSKSQRYENCVQYDTDGDLGEGFIITTTNINDWRVMFKVIPNYTIYGK